MLFKKYYAQMLTLSLRYTNDEFAAKDIVSEGFMKAFNNLNKFEFKEGKGLNSWLKKIMVNECLMYIRKNKKLKLNVSLEVVENIDYSGFENSIDSELIHNCIRKLPDGYRTVLNMYVVEGYSHKEIADKLNITESSSRSQLTHAKRKMQQFLKGNYERRMA